MAKYINSPWGEIHGKLGEVIGSVAINRIKTVRAYKKPESRGTDEAIFKVLQGKMDKQDLFIPHINLTHTVTSTLSCIARIYRDSIITPIWNQEAKRVHYFSGFPLVCEI
ncbi:MAG: hypothetical protein QMD71_01385 [bacterium]|nr:hypothetical protein [bacterium]